MLVTEGGIIVMAQAEKYEHEQFGRTTRFEVTIVQAAFR
jgi:hypothetical protein